MVNLFAKNVDRQLSQKQIDQLAGEFVKKEDDMDKIMINNLGSVVSALTIEHKAILCEAEKLLPKIAGLNDQIEKFEVLLEDTEKRIMELSCLQKIKMQIFLRKAYCKKIKKIKKFKEQMELVRDNLLKRAISIEEQIWTLRGIKCSLECYVYAIC
jgi:hypothetical protein